MRKTRTASIARAYQACASAVLTGLLVLILANWAILLAFRAKRALFPTKGFFPELSDKFTPDGAPVPNGKRSEGYQVALFDRAAFGDAASDREIGEMLDEFYDLGAVAPSYLGMGLINLPPFDGKHVRLLTDEAGVRFRRTPSSAESRQGSDVVTIYVFGGGTTFGLHVADEQTWPSFLDRHLSKSRNGKRVVVRNYGRPGYDSSSELRLFLLLLQRGQRPDIAIFMDGVTENFAPDGHLQDRELAKLVDESRLPVTAALSDLPVVRESGFALLAQSLGRATGRTVASVGTSAQEPCLTDDAAVDNAARVMADKYRVATRHIEAIARANGVRTYFFLEPDSSHNYPRHLFRRYPPSFSDRLRQSKERFYAIVRKESRSIYLGDLFRSWGDRKAIVDDYHYSPGFSELVAREIASRLAPALGR